MLSKTLGGMTRRVVLITGASAGIGEGTALFLASLGCKLSLVGRNEKSLTQIADKCKELGSPDTIWIAKDVSSEKACSDIVNKTLNHYGELDSLVNNAGIYYKYTLNDMTQEAFDNSMNINVKAALNLTKLSAPSLAKSTKLPSIVNVSSIAGLRAFPGALAYKISKAAMDQMTRCTALELASQGIRVNSVNPGVIETNLFLKSGMTAESNKEYMNRAKLTHPIGRPGRVDEVAKSIAFLLSEDSSFILGQTLSVDGGRSITCLS